MKYLFRKKRNIFFASVLDAVGYAARGLFASRCPRFLGEAPHFLVIRLDHIGDVLLATAVPKALKENFPKARVTFLTGSGSMVLLENNSFIDEILLYDAPWFARGSGRAASPGFFALGQKLRTLKIDAALGLRGDLRENFLMALARIPRRVGFGVTGGGFWLTDEAVYREGIHEEEHLRDLLALIGIRAQVLKPQLYVSTSEDGLFEEKRKMWGLSDQTRWVGFQADAGSAAKEWPVENSRAFIKLFAERFPGCGLVFLGSQPKKIELPEQSMHLNLTGKTSLRDLLAVMQKLKAFVGPDSGPAHIASAMGVPTIFLYSGTNVFDRWKPLSDNAKVLRHPVSCAPCFLNRCVVEGHPCMAHISAEQVFQAVQPILK